ncbi:hypothetical protein LTR85_002994 [Meristemomyces frigidus]|nr:hypothetical protein LTR85_002994 [Meristemomyces frigidus]
MAARTDSKGAIEKSLGFWWPRGLSRTKGRLNYPAIKNLLTDLDQVTHKQARRMTPRDLRTSPELKAAADLVFDRQGPHLWPDSWRRPPWLADAAAGGNLSGLYPRDLYYSRPEDRDLLRTTFHDLVVAKCLRYQSNHRGYLVTPSSQPTAIRSPAEAKDPERPSQSAEEEEEEDDDDDDDDDDDSFGDDGDTDYSPINMASAQPTFRKKPRPASGTAGGPAPTAQMVEPEIIDLTCDTNSATSSTAGRTEGRGRADATEAALVTTGPSGSNKRSHSCAPQEDNKRARQDSGNPSLVVVLKLDPKRCQPSSIASPARTPLSSPTSPLPSVSARSSFPKASHLGHVPLPPADPKSLAVDQPRARIPTPDEPDPPKSSNGWNNQAHYYALASSTLGEDINTPTARILLRAAGMYDKHELTTLKYIMDRYPKARTDIDTLVSILTAERALESSSLAQIDRRALHVMAQKAAGPPIGLALTDVLPPTHADALRDETQHHVQEQPKRIEAVGDRALGGINTVEHARTDKERTEALAAHSLADHIADAADLSSSRNATAQSPITATPTVQPSTAQQLANSKGEKKAVTQQPNPRSTQAQSHGADQVESKVSSSLPGDTTVGSNIANPEKAEDVEAAVVRSPSSKTILLSAAAAAPPPGPVTNAQHFIPALGRGLLRSCKYGATAPPHGPGPVHNGSGNSVDILERTTVEVDWLDLDKFPGSIPLEACCTAEDFFAEIDHQVPATLKKRSMRAVKIEHVNAQICARAVSCRIVRLGGAGVATFRTLLRRLRQLGDEAYPELRVTVE